MEVQTFFRQISYKSNKLISIKKKKKNQIHTCTVLVFIRIIQAVVIAITNPGFWYASLVVACEIPRVWTSLDRRLCIRISLACSVITCKTFTIRTTTSDFQAHASSIVGWYWEAKFLTVSIIIPARM